MATMRAWVVDGTGSPAEVLDLRSVELPDPPPGFLRLRVAAAAVGLPDVLMCRGSYPLTPDGPFTPGQEMAGTVTAVGDGLDADLIGTRRMGVTAFYLGRGGFADEALAPEATTYPAPDWLADTDAAGFHIPFMTARVALRDRAAIAPASTSSSWARPAAPDPPPSSSVESWAPTSSPSPAVRSRRSTAGPWVPTW